MGLSSAGTDSFTDVGFDTQYQYLGDPHTVTARVAWIHENHNTSASQTLGLADNSNNQLRSLNASLSYIYDKTWSFTGGRMSIGGTPDATLYGTLPEARTAPTGSPRSPICRSCVAAHPFGQWLNARIGLQWIRWDKFDGASTNFNGAGRNARANNTIFGYVWIAFRWSEK